jgi:hypothetical protein
LKTALSILGMLVGPVCAVLVVLLMARGSEPAKYRSLVRVAVAIGLTLFLSHVADFVFSVTSSLVSFGIGIFIALVIGAGFSLVESSIKSKSTSN